MSFSEIYFSKVTIAEHWVTDHWVELPDCIQSLHEPCKLECTRQSSANAEWLCHLNMTETQSEKTQWAHAHSLCDLQTTWQVSIQQLLLSIDTICFELLASPVNVCSHLPARHNLINLSAEPVSMKPPSGMTATHHTAASCPEYNIIHCLVQILITSWI